MLTAESEIASCPDEEAFWRTTATVAAAMLTEVVPEPVITNGVTRT
jgi:hypothetical protein